MSETSSYAPNSPYSTSKASSGQLVPSWRETYGLPTVITNCSNNFGPYHFPEKLIPHIMIKALASQAIPVFGEGQNVHDWRFFEDRARALTLVAEHGVIGQTYAIGTRNERTDIHIAQLVCASLDEIEPAVDGRKERLMTFVSDRPRHDRRYTIDPSKIEHELGWTESESFETALAKPSIGM